MCSVPIGLVLAACVSCAFTQLNATQGCTYNGHVYSIGEEFKSSPCVYCHCSANGQISCALADCAYPLCGNQAVHHPTECCPVCPPIVYNCRSSDGTIIEQGEVYKLASFRKGSQGELKDGCVHIQKPILLERSEDLSNKPDPYTTCECPRSLFMFGATSAICTKHPVPATTRPTVALTPFSPTQAPQTLPPPTPIVV